MVEKITLLDEKGESFQSDELAVFAANGKKFLVSTDNSLDPNGLVVVNVSEVTEDKLNGNITSPDWEEVCDTMRAIIAGGEGVNFEPVIDQANVNKASYFRSISINGDAVKEMKEVYASKRPVPQPNVDAPAVDGVNNEAENPNMFNANMQSIYPNASAPVVGDMSQAQVGMPVANGITEITANESNPTNFQQVSNLGNPVDLMDNNVAQNVAASVVPETQVVQPQYDNQYDVNNIANTVVSQIGQVDPEIAGYLQSLNATIINVVEAIKQQEMVKINSERMALEAEKKDFDLRKAGFEAQLMRGINQNPMINQQMMAQPVQPIQTPVATPVPPVQQAMVNNQAGLNPNMMNQSMMGQTPMTMDQQTVPQQNQNPIAMPQQMVESQEPVMTFGNVA